MIPRCFNCSHGVLYPDGGLRCDLDNHLAVNPCAQHTFGKVKIYEIKPEQVRITKQKAKPIKAVKSVKGKKIPTPQRRLL